MATLSTTSSPSSRFPSSVQRSASRQDQGFQGHFFLMGRYTGLIEVKRSCRRPMSQRSDHRFGLGCARKSLTVPLDCGFGLDPNIEPKNPGLLRFGARDLVFAEA